MAIDWKEATRFDDFEQFELIDQLDGVLLAEVGVGVYLVEAWGSRQIFTDWHAAQASYLWKLNREEGSR